MAKPSKRSPRSFGKTSQNNRRLFVFIISIVLIGLMLWQVLLTLGASSRAAGGRGAVCRPQNDRQNNRNSNRSVWTRLGICHTERPETCGAESCTCVPFRRGFKFGRCVSKLDITPTIPPPTATPTPPPPGMLSCGQTCETDNQCASGYCHDPNWQACPTETPEPTERPRPNKTPRPTKMPKPTKMCAIRGDNLVPLPKQCRDRECFAGEQCACPAPTEIPNPTIIPTEGVACTADAKLCPDGSYVGRVPPTCEFAPCPGE